MTLRKRFAVGVVAVTATAGAVLAAVPAQAVTAPAAGESVTAAPCTWVYQYVVTADGDMTDAPSGGNRIGDALRGDTFNVRVFGDPRYYGANVSNGRWGWILASKLSRTSTPPWCA